MDQTFFIYAAAVPLLGIMAQWIAWRIRLPSILLLLSFGVALGQFFNPDEILAKMAHASVSSDIGPKILFPLVSLSVGVILFEGGLSLRINELRQAGKSVLRLVTVGTLITAVLTSIAAYYVLELDWRIAVLLGGLLVVTGPTVVLPLLRHIRPNKRIGTIVKWEGIVIDPIGAILAVLIFERLIHHGADATLNGLTILIILKTIVVGALLGVATAFMLLQMIKRYLVPDYLHGAFFLTVAIGVFALSNVIQEESGLVTVTVLGVLLANQKSVSIEHVVQFKENLGVLLISCLFIVLGSRLNLSALLDVGPRGLLFLVVLILLIRPVSVFVSTLGTDMNIKEKTFLAFLAPRGIVAAAVASVFGLHIGNLAAENGYALPMTESLVADADKLAPITFLVIVGTVAVYGLGASPLARLLKLDDSNPQGILFAGAQPWVRRIGKSLQDAGFAVALVDTNYRHVSVARQEGLSAYCLSVVSEELQEEVDFAGIGRLLAMTGSDEVNALATQELKHFFGRKNVYQLTPRDAGAGARASVSERLRGRTLFNETIDFDKLSQYFQRGWELKTTNLTPEFTYREFREMYGPEALVMFAMDANQMMTITSPDETLELHDQHTIIALIDPNQVNRIDGT